VILQISEFTDSGMREYLNTIEKAKRDERRAKDHGNIDSRHPEKTTA